MVVVVVRGDEKWMQSYGQTYPGSHQKPNADSWFAFARCQRS